MYFKQDDALRIQLRCSHAAIALSELVSCHNLFARYHAAVAIRGWIRTAIVAAGCTYVRCHAAVAIRGGIRPAIFAAGCTNTCTLSCGSCSTCIDSTGNFCCRLHVYFRAVMRQLQYVDSPGPFCCWLRIFASKHISGLNT